MAEAFFLYIQYKQPIPNYFYHLRYAIFCNFAMSKISKSSNQMFRYSDVQTLIICKSDNLQILKQIATCLLKNFSKTLRHS